MSLADMLAIEAAVEGGKVEEAGRRLASAPTDESDVGVYAAYLRARILQFSGRLPEARNEYRRILGSHPELTRVRLALAQSLGQMQDYQGARHNYELALGAIGDVATDNTAAERIRNDLTALTNAKRWTAQLNLAAVPTDNLNNGITGNNVNIGGINFTPVDAGKKKAGVAFLYGGEFAYLQPLTEDIGLLGSFSGNNYDAPGTGFDLRVISASLGPQLRIWSGNVSAEAIASRTWYGGSGYDYSYGGRLSSRFLLSDKLRATGAVTFTWQDYDTATYLSGTKLTSNISVDRFTLPGQFLRVGFTTDRERDNNSVWSYQEYGALIGYYLETSFFGLTFYPEVSYAWRKYDTDFPLSSSPRADNRTTAALTITKRDFQIYGFAPRITYAYVKNDSNVGLFEYSKQSIVGLLVKDF